MFKFKHRVYNWLKESETEISAKKAYSKDQSQPALAVVERRDRVVVVAEVDAPGKEPWWKRQIWLR